MFWAMSFPTQTDLEVPLLRMLDAANGQAIPRELYAPLAAQFSEITEADLQQRMDGGAVKWWNHVQWVRQKLVQRGEIDGSIHGVWRISDAGRARLRNGTTEGVVQAPAVQRPLGPTSPPIAPDGERRSPSEVIEVAHREIREALVSELLQMILGQSPAFFEQLVIDLLVKMGYGGSRKDAGETLGRVGDGGIDGIIKEDRLGLGLIYVQAKRWAPGRTIGRPDLQQFAGALRDNQAQKGVFITTSTFTRDAIEAGKRSDPKIALIDGQALAHLMIEFGLGVATVAAYSIQRIDSDYFGDE